jgi:hypothetical protein
MIFAKFFSKIIEALWLVGGIGAAADLSLDEFGSGAYFPCPRDAEYPYCANLEAIPCRSHCSISSSTRPSR